MSAASIVPAPHPRAALALLALLGGCAPQVELDTDATSATSVGDSTVGDSTVGTDPDGATDPDGTTDGPVPTERAVDILFVVDNSGSMGEEQGKLASGIESLVAVLDGASPPVDYRIAVTTTDNGNPWCGTTGPEGGSFRATSCRARPTEFVFNGATVIDANDIACNDVCTLETLGIDDGRPWIDVQRSISVTNVGDAVVDNLRCMLPQGIDGCGFESHLESLWKGIRRTQTAGDEAYGFVREGALFAAIIVTDEVDCSYNNEWESIFLPDGNRVFWSDPSAPSPTSALCWNAGVACNGNTCFSVNLDVDGGEVFSVDADDDAVLRPMSRYTEIVSEVGGYVFAINGVTLDGSIVYQPALDDPAFQNDFGIGPGCQTPDGTAVPPVRVHELVEAISGPGHEASICAPELGSALTAFGQGILARLP